MKLSEKSKARSVEPPLWLLAEVTYRCPLNCVFCYNPVDYAKELLGILKPKVGKDLTCDALLTLNRPTDNALVADWIRRFFLQHAVS